MHNFTKARMNERKPKAPLFNARLQDRFITSIKCRVFCSLHLLNCFCSTIWFIFLFIALYVLNILCFCSCIQAHKYRSQHGLESKMKPSHETFFWMKSFILVLFSYCQTESIKRADVLRQFQFASVFQHNNERICF